MFNPDLNSEILHWFVNVATYGAAILGSLVVIYIAARLVSLAWHRTKREYDKDLFE